MPLPIIITGILILVSTFSYSILTTINRNDEVLSLDETTVKELMPNAMANTMDMDNMGMPMFSDGTYASAVKYEVPYGYIEPMEVSLTFKGGIVTDAAVSFDVVNPVSADYQNAFENYYKGEVIGRSVEDVSLSRMGGASLTNRGFDAALTAIKAEASGGTVPTAEVVPFEQSSPVMDFNVVSSNDIYKDGTYVVENTYYVMPGFNEPMQTTVTLENNIISDTEVRFASRDPHSLTHQRDFAVAYKDEVIGVPLGEASFSRIGRASLTTIGFNNALKEIRLEALES